MTPDYHTTRSQRLGESFFNYAVTHVPSHNFRQWYLRRFGATIGRDVGIMMGTHVLGVHRLVVGDGVSIGSNVVLDARGGLTIDTSAVIASDVYIVTAKHVVDSPDFEVVIAPVHVKHHAWVASRATVLQGVTVGVGAVVGACSLVNKDVDDMAIVAGTPARTLGKRESNLSYYPKFRPVLY